ncbi:MULTISPECIES: hypothetical protein [Cylindrospermopsis]|nr:MULTISPECIES: hypothetical protein [Cylindrospermopsis]
MTNYPMWFEALTGFQEMSPDQVRGNLSVDGTRLKSHVNEREYTCGWLEVPSLKELRNRIRSTINPSGSISVRDIIANVQEIHIDRSNAGALFQVASQFNLLEMISPNVSPEQGIARYEYDPTQGPACAIAAGAGTIYRNYFVNVNGKIGQTAENQIDCLADLGEKLGNLDNRLWVMQNGYALVSEYGLMEINSIINSSNEVELDELRNLLRIGIQWHTEVTIGPSNHSVTQVYCSALPVSYSPHPPEKWATFARFILEASYEAVLCAGLLNAKETGNNKIYLTLLGGGAFGNKMEWIIQAIRRSLVLYRHYNLEVYIVSYRQLNHQVKNLIYQF